MNSTIKVIPRVTRLINYIQEIEQGKIRIPSFQRDFIWGNKEKKELFESLERGYPIGSLLFWKPEESFRTKDEIGPYRLSYKSKSKDFFYILDGFQRMSTLFGCLINPAKTNLVKIESLLRDFALYYDLEEDEFVFPRGTPTDSTSIPVNILIDTFGLLDYGDRLRKAIGNNAADKLISKARILASTLLDYELPTIQIVGGSIEDAVDIFSRINSKGSKISSDWMVSALTYNEEKDFRLGTEIDKLIEELELFNFNKIKRELILQCIQSSFGKIYFDEKIVDLVKKSDFISVSKKTLAGIKKAVKFLFEHLLVIDSKLLPYNNQLIFVTWFFSEIESPTNEQLTKLKEWFWITTYSNYFTIYSLSKQRLAFEHFKKFIKGIEQHAVYNDKPSVPFVVPDFPKNIYFGSVRVKALVLFLLNRFNEFKTAKSQQIDELKIYYLLPDTQDASAVLPTVGYIADGVSKNLIEDKVLNLETLIRRDNFPSIAEKYCISSEVIQLYNKNEGQKMLDVRKLMLQEAEREFANSLGLVYPT